MGSRRLVLTLYRCLLRNAREMDRSNEKFLVRKPMDLRAFETGWHALYRPGKSGPAYRLAAVKQLIGDTDVTDLDLPASGFYDGATVHRLTQTLFKRHKDSSQEAVLGLVNQGLAAVRGLHHQRVMQSASSTTITRGILVDATSAHINDRHLPHLRAPGDDYNFTYRVYLENNGTEDVQLQSRHWLISDSKGVVMVVPQGSSGVVGKYPLLKPGDAFEYYSITNIGTRTGHMRGSFQMAVLENLDECIDTFDAEVDAFKLIAAPEVDSDGPS